jgi:hydrogenase/urease accessory protein HupE
MSVEVARFIPIAGLFIGLLVAFAFDPTADRAAWWGAPAGLLVGYAVRFGMQRYGNARR